MYQNSFPISFSNVALGEELERKCIGVGRGEGFSRRRIPLCPERLWWRARSIGARFGNQDSVSGRGKRKERETEKTKKKKRQNKNGLCTTSNTQSDVKEKTSAIGKPAAERGASV